MVELKASVEVIEKYEPRVRQAFADFLAALPSNIATAKVVTETEEPSHVERTVSPARRKREASVREAG